MSGRSIAEVPEDHGWETANRITRKKSQGTLVSLVLSPDVINAMHIFSPLIRIAPMKLLSLLKYLLEFVLQLWMKVLLENCSHTRRELHLDRMSFHIGSGVTTPIIWHLLLWQFSTAVPTLWKLANVSPIPKESPLMECNQLRPISLTNIIMRIFERLVCKQELSHMLKDEICPDQFAYMERRSTSMALIKCQHH